MTNARTFALSLVGTGLFSLAATAGAQTSPPAGQTAPVAGANGQVAGDIAASQAATLSQNADAQAQYASDVAAYRAAVRRNNVQVAISQDREAAYAQAMRDWRIQVIDCKRGITAACDAPTPDPADYY